MKIFQTAEILQLESLYRVSDILNSDENIRIPYSFLKPVLCLSDNNFTSEVTDTDEVNNYEEQKAADDNTAETKDKDNNSDLILKKKSAVFI